MNFPLSQLLIKQELYTRSKVSTTNVTMLKAAIKKGDQLPPIVTWDETKWIVDGVHRWHAYKSVLGLNCEVPVEWRSYENQAAFLYDCIELNSKHGLQLTSEDCARICHIADSVGLSEEYLVEFAIFTAPRIADVTARVATIAKDVVLHPRAYSSPLPVNANGDRMLPLSAGAKDLAGKTLNQDEYNAAVSANATSKETTFVQAILFLKAGLIPHQNIPFRAKFRELHALLGAWLEEEETLVERALSE
jgi:hypothetical protein